MRLPILILLAGLGAAACGRAPRPNVLLVTIDTFRADRLTPTLTPTLDRVARSGLRFTRARTAVPLTLPSHTTILTGLLPPAHGVRENGVDRLDPSHATIAALLGDAGYRTAAFIGAFVLDRRFGLSRGFSTYDDDIPRDPMLIRAGSASELYDLDGDPAEAHDAAAAQPSVVAAMASRINAVHAASSARAAANLASEDASARLRALGYVSGGTASGAPHGDEPNPSSRIAEWNAFETALAELNEGSQTAVAPLERLARENTGAPVFQSMYARALEQAGQLPQALDVYRRAAHRWPGDPELLHDFAVAARAAAVRADEARQRALRTEAAQAEQAALVIAPDSAMSHNSLGLIAADDGRHDDAAAEFDRATSLDPANPSYWVNLRNARRALGSSAAAEQAYRHALALSPRDVDAANGLGVLLVEANHPVEAAPWFERAVDTSPGFVEARLNLGIALQQAGEPRRAADAYRAVLAAPGDHLREKQAAARLLASLGASR